jgi:hypothetical protein
MNEEITATAIFDLPTLLEGRKWFNHLNPMRRMVRAILLVAILAAAGFSITHYSEESKDSLIYLSVALVVGWLFGTLFERQIFISGIKSSPLFGQQIVYKAQESALGVESSVATSTLSWNAFLKTVGTPVGALLYQQKCIFNWLPKTAFTSETDYTRFLEIIAAKTKHSKIG